MSYYLTDNAIQQVPRVTSPGDFDRELFGQLAIDRLNQPTFAVQSFNGRLGKGVRVQALVEARQLVGGVIDDISNSLCIIWSR